MIARTNLLKISLVAAVALLAAALLVLVAAEKPAKAAFPGKNGLLVFTSDRDSERDSAGKITQVIDELYAIDAEPRVVGEGDVRRLTTYDPNKDPRLGLVQAPAVSPDGTKVAFLSDRYYPTDPSQPRQFQIYVMDLQDRDGDGNGDNLTCLTCKTNDVPGSVGYIYPQERISWSKDMKQIAFAGNQGGDFDIWVMSLTYENGNVKDVSPPTNLIDAASDIRYLANGTQTPAADGGPVFSDKGEIAFASNRYDPSDGTSDFDIWVGSLTYGDNGNVTGVSGLTNLTNNMVDPVTNAPTQELHPTWAPDGSKIALYSSPGIAFYTASDIWVMSLTYDANGNITDGSPPTNLTDNGPDVGDIQPNWGVKK